MSGPTTRKRSSALAAQNRAARKVWGPACPSSVSSNVPLRRAAPHSPALVSRNGPRAVESELRLPCRSGSGPGDIGNLNGELRCGPPPVLEGDEDPSRRARDTGTDDTEARSGTAEAAVGGSPPKVAQRLWQMAMMKVREEQGDVSFAPRSMMSCLTGLTSLTSLLRSPGRCNR